VTNSGTAFRFCNLTKASSCEGGNERKLEECVESGLALGLQNLYMNTLA
jgi:hypothetical protein